MRSFYDGGGRLTVLFTDPEAFRHAAATWDASRGLVLIVYAEGCGDHAKGERCYLLVSKLRVCERRHVIYASGEPRHPDDVISLGETE